MSTYWELNVDLTWGSGQRVIRIYTIPLQSLCLCQKCRRDLHETMVKKLDVIVAKVAAMMVVILLLLSANMEGVKSEVSPWCYDYCDMGCIHFGPDQPRLYERCERKCQIKCSPDSEGNGRLN